MFSDLVGTQNPENLETVFKPSTRNPKKINSFSTLTQIIQKKNIFRFHDVFYAYLNFTEKSKYTKIYKSKRSLSSFCLYYIVTAKLLGSNLKP